MEITKLKFQEATGQDPVQDDLERANCKDAGKIGHSFCGWCGLHDKPRFVCGCILTGPEPKRTLTITSKGEKDSVQELVGKKIVAIRGFQLNEQKAEIPVTIILLDDGETMLKFEEQDYHCYHDSNLEARMIEIVVWAEEWRRIFENEKGLWPKANTPLAWPW